MFNQTAGNNSKLAQSVQRDYQQAARNHRLAKESGYQGVRFNGTTIGLVLTAGVAATVLTIAQSFFA